MVQFGVGVKSKAVVVVSKPPPMSAAVRTEVKPIIMHYTTIMSKQLCSYIQKTSC